LCFWVACDPPSPLLQDVLMVPYPLQLNIFLRKQVYGVYVFSDRPDARYLGLIRFKQMKSERTFLRTNGVSVVEVPAYQSDICWMATAFQNVIAIRLRIT